MKYTVAVRTLCEFTAKRGNLDARFTPSPSAMEGIAGHRVIATRRAANCEKASYEREIPLEGDYGPLLRVRGRADGYDPQQNLLEEYKTYRGDLARMRDNHRALHWAQLRIYGWLLCKLKGLAQLRLAIVYFDMARESETLLDETRSADWLQQHFEAHCRQFVSWAEAETAHRTLRDESMRSLRFPFPDFHAGQRQLAESVYRRARTGGVLLAQAPTGIGKTVGTLFPALKALATARLDKVFYLVAKTSGRQLALDALRRLQPQNGSLPLRGVEMVARHKACEHPDLPCDGAVCPLARGFYDRLPAARAEGTRGGGILSRDAVRELAHHHQVCPYYLSQELARWSDVVIGDYNYYFDRGGMLFGWTTSQEWKVCLLVDEAHNLIERARAMYSTELDHAAFQEAVCHAPDVVSKALEKVARAWSELVAAQDEVHRVYELVPAGLLAVLERSISAISDYLSAEPDAVREPLLELYFDALGFCRLAAELDASSMFEITRGGEGGSVLRLRNVVPGRFLGPRFAAATVSVLFSATLTPDTFFRDLLGLPSTAEYIDVDSPFSTEQLAVRLIPSISTRFRDRERSVVPICELLASQYAARPGNYIAFLSSFEYLNRIAARMATRYSAIPLWKQHAGMTEPEREDFLARFVPDGCGIGFAVLGGAFAEAVDLPGSRLIGAFIATLGLPQVNAVNAEMQRRMESMFGSGYEYTYLYPGLQKVVQAAGRVIRTTADRGVLYLIDDRFAGPAVRKLLPRWWTVDRKSRAVPVTSEMTSGANSGATSGTTSGVPLGEALFDMPRQLGRDFADPM